MHDSRHHLRLALAIHEKSPVPEGVARPPFAQVDRYTMKYSAENAAEYSILTLPRMVFMRKDKYVKHMSWGDLQGLLSFLPPPRYPGHAVPWRRLGGRLQRCRSRPTSSPSLYSSAHPGLG